VNNMDDQHIVSSGSSNTLTIVEMTVFDASWRPVSEFPEMREGDTMIERGHEMRSDVLWLYQPAHESKHHQTEEVTVWRGHVYLGMCIRPLIRAGEDYDYGDPYFVDLAHRSICHVTMWRHLDRPSLPYDPLEAKGGLEGTIFNPEFHQGNKIVNDRMPSNFS
jgi:hypothetical protein